MSDIAAKAGTSVAAVSVALNGARSKTLQLSSETRARIRTVAEELGYRRNPLAGALATGKTRVLGLMLPYSFAYVEHDPFFSLLTTGVTRCASAHGYNVMLYSAVAEDEGSRAAKMINRMVAGLIFVSPPPDTPLYAECERQGIPYIAVIASNDTGPFTVNSDDYQGGLLATRHLLSLGHRRIAHLEGRRGVITTRPRLEGYLAALREALVQPDSELIVPGDFNLASGYNSSQRLMRLPADRRPTAIFAANDLAAHGAIDAVQDAGLIVPDDVAIVGYDDTWYAAVTRPALTTISMDVPNLGHQAASMLLSHLDEEGPDEAHVILPVSLHVRETCGVLKRPKT